MGLGAQIDEKVGIDSGKHAIIQMYYEAAKKYIEVKRYYETYKKNVKRNKCIVIFTRCITYGIFAFSTIITILGYIG